jgi:serine/threonine-protein kinase
MARSRDDHPLVGVVVGGKYCVVGVLHRGRRNDLFVAQETHGNLVRSLVLKVPHELSNASAEVLAREAGFLSQLDHPNVVATRDVGIDDERVYLVLDPVDGETLADTLERGGPMDEREVLSVFWQILSATKAMHEAGIVHRDLRPRNVCLEHREGLPDQVKLIDFAAAKFLRASHPDATTEPAYPIGLSRYMAPEQHRGEPAAPAVDVYAVGMMLHAALVGELPAPGARLSEAREVSRELDDVVARALAEDPAARFRSAADFQEALTRALLVG